MKLYETLADTLRERIRAGFYGPGAKLPSVRQLSTEHQLSISTAQQALLLLEQEAWVEIRPKSGCYVRARTVPTAMPQVSRATQYPLEVSQWAEVHALLAGREQPQLLNLGSGLCDVHQPTLKPLLRILGEQVKREGMRSLIYDSLPGASELREQVARLALASETRLHPDDLITTTGCQEALSISIQAVTQPGDVVAVESPGFYGLMQILNARGLKALEIPTHPTEGMGLDALELALDQWPIKAILVIPSHNNPLGYCMPDDNKQRLLRLAQRYDVPIIEDDIYGDLSYRQPRPRSIQSFDTEGRVILCSSVSKTLAVGLRVGWIAPGRYRERVTLMKYVGTAAAASLTQLAVAEFIRQGYYERHLRTMRQHYLAGRDAFIQTIQQCFPADTRVSFPQGGYMLWVELPPTIDTTELNRRLAAHQIMIAPGVIFSASGKYRHCLRLNYARGLDPARLEALRLIGREAMQLANPSG